MSDFQFVKDDNRDPTRFANAHFFSNPINWIESFEDYCGSSDCLEVDRINRPPIDQIKTGDILFFYDKKSTRHIGICLQLGNNLVFFDSGGNPNKSCNEAIEKGPRRLILTKRLLKGWPGKRHGIIRIKNFIE